MASSFLGLYVQREALLISQKALDITGNNISNINTEGYTRQRVDICSVANVKGTLGYNTGVTLAGKGSDVVGVAQIRDRLLDKKVRNYSGDLCDVGVKMNVLSDVEDVFDAIETDELGKSFAAIVNQFKESLQSFSVDNADRSEMATIAVNNAESLVQAVVTYNSKLNDISEQTLGEAQATVKRINSIFAEMGSLNEQIKDAYISMGYIESSSGNYEVQNDYGPLELKDKMHSLLDELSQYGNMHVTEEDDGTFTVDFAGQNVVSGKTYAQMAITKETPEPTELEYVIATDLKDKDEWYNLNVDHQTGGDSQILIRGGNAGATQNITGTDDNGEYYLDTGSLRGYLDVYNGRGIYAKTTETIVNNAVNEANAALAKLAGGGLTDDELTAVTQTLQDTVGASVTDNGNGTYSVSVGGVTILDGTNYAEITVNDNGTASVADINDPTADPAEVTLGGTAGSNIADTAIYENSYQGIEYYRDMLNAFVKTAADEFNGVFSGITDADGNKIELFTYADDNNNPEFRTAAENFRVAQYWQDNPDCIANPTGSNDFAELDNTYINKLLGVFASEHEYGDGNVSDPQQFNLEKYVAHICDNLGTQVEYETGVYEATDVMLTSVETARSEVQDVSMDEEGINMMNYQKWYNAIARMITALDEALDKLINGTGRVGL